jgi:GTP cyclohydrolase II
MSLHPSGFSCGDERRVHAEDLSASVAADNRRLCKAAFRAAHTAAQHRKAAG